MSIYVLIIKADNTGKIGIYRFFEGNGMWANGVMVSRYGVCTFPQQPQRAERAIFHTEQQKIRTPATENPPAHNILRHLILTLQRTWYGLDKALCPM